MTKLSCAADIRPLFRAFDVDNMKPMGVDLSSYDAVKHKAVAIHEALTDQTMPCDAPWPPEKIQKFKDWLDGGMLP